MPPGTTPPSTAAPPPPDATAIFGTAYVTYCSPALDIAALDTAPLDVAAATNDAPGGTPPPEHPHGRSVSRVRRTPHTAHASRVSVCQPLMDVQRIGQD